jgi:hypothetical protein
MRSRGTPLVSSGVPGRWRAAATFLARGTLSTIGPSERHRRVAHWPESDGQTMLEGYRAAGAHAELCVPVLEDPAEAID